MAESIGSNLDLGGDAEAVKQFEKRRVGRRVFFACDCVAYTPEQLGLRTRSRAAEAPPPSVPGGPVPIGAAAKNIARWPRGVVPFRFTTPTLSTELKAMFREACLVWERAVGRNAAGRPFVSFVEIASASAAALHIRVRAGSPNINMASTGAVADGFVEIGHPNKGSLVHELGHVLGLVHEHQRHDRDQFVTRGAAVANNANFRLHSRSEDTIQTDYDFGSIMHYGREVMLNGQRVVALTPKPQFQAQAAVMGQRNGPSASDIAAIRQLYP